MTDPRTAAFCCLRERGKPRARWRKWQQGENTMTDPRRCVLLFARTGQAPRALPQLAAGRKQ
jgi:hypothetical protein